jgi:peroxiredoxin
MLMLFVVAISVNLARGQTHDCHCFGQLYSRPLGWPTLVRNLVFALGAGFVWWQAGTNPGPGIVGTLGDLNSSEWLLLLGAVAVVVGILIYLRRRHKHLPVETSKAPIGLPLNSVAPSFELKAYAGGTISLTRLLAYGKPLLLIFTNPTCGPCVVLFAEVKEWQQSHSEQLTIALISFGTIKENFVNVARNRLGQVLLQQKREVAEKYGANVTPTAVVVSTDGRIASPIAAGADEIRKLLTTVVEHTQDGA